MCLFTDSDKRGKTSVCFGLLELERGLEHLWMPGCYNGFPVFLSLLCMETVHTHKMLVGSITGRGQCDVVLRSCCVFLAPTTAQLAGTALDSNSAGTALPTRSLSRSSEALPSSLCGLGCCQMLGWVLENFLLLLLQTMSLRREPLKIQTFMMDWTLNLLCGVCLM